MPPSWKADCIPSTVSDVHLDAYAAGIILKRSTSQSEKYDKQGIRAFLEEAQPSGAPLTNKRFLGAVLRNVERHNQSVIRQQSKEANQGQRSRQGQGMRGWNDHEERDKGKGRAYDAPPSKMDKYFEEDYDPAKDITMDDRVDPHVGMIAGSQSGWDRMLDLLKHKDDGKRKRKEERDRIRKERSERRSRKRSSASPERERHTSHHDRDRKRSSRHHKRRSRSPLPGPPKVREWDLGKPSLG